MACQNCGEQVVQTPGKRVKEFCGSTCRSNYWQKKKRKSTVDIIAPSRKKLKISDLPTKDKPKVEFKQKSVESIKPEPKEGSMAWFLKYPDKIK